MQIVMTKQIHNGGGAIALDSGMRHKTYTQRWWDYNVRQWDETKTDTQRWWDYSVGQWDETKKRGRNRYRTVVVVVGGGGGGLDSGMRQKRILSFRM